MSGLALSKRARCCCFLLGWSHGRCNNVVSFQGYTSDRDIWGRVISGLLVVGGFSELPLAMGSASIDKAKPRPSVRKFIKGLTDSTRKIRTAEVLGWWGGVIFLWGEPFQTISLSS